MAKYAKDSKKDKKLNKKKEIFKIFQNILLVIFIIIFLVSGVLLLKWILETGNSKIKYEELAEEVISIKDENSSDDSGTEKYSKEIEIDFEKLKSINSDVLAWIKIDGTTINYPVMQTTNNDYYLKNNFYKEYDICGALFFDYKNNMVDKNIVIYGHNIKRGMMFSDLKKIVSGNLGNKVEITLFMESQTMNFEVFSSYYTEPEDYAINTLITEEDLLEFKNEIKNRSSINFESDYINSNQILTLSTCDGTGKRRILVHAGIKQ